MTMDERLCRAVEALGIPIEPGVDTSAEGEYAVYSYTRSGTLWGDDAPCLEQRRWSLVYVAPLAVDRTETRLDIMQAVFAAFGAWPAEEDFSDENGQRWLYSFDTAGGLDDGTDDDE